MQLLDEHLYKLYEDGLVLSDDAVEQSRHPGEMQDKIDSHRRKMSGVSLESDTDRESRVMKS